jgi:hypothetical protein
MCRQIFSRLELHDPSGIDIVNALLDEVPELFDASFLATERPKACRNDLVCIPVNASG